MFFPQNKDSVNKKALCHLGKTPDEDNLNVVDKHVPESPVRVVLSNEALISKVTRSCILFERTTLNY